jgi:hypothetical protein
VIPIEPGTDEEYPYRTHALLYGGSVYIKAPPETLEHCDLDQLKHEDGPERVPMIWLPEEGPEGPYYSTWNQGQTGKDTEE